MANVAGVAQLMETVGSSTPAPPPSPALKHSFATAMHRANQDAGLPSSPVDEQEAAESADASPQANKHGERASSKAPVTDAQPVTTKSHPVAAPPYTSANMLSAMPGTPVPPTAAGIVDTSIAPAPVAPPSAPAVTPTTPVDLPVQAAATTPTEPLDLSPPVLPAFTGVAPSSKAAAKTVTPSTPTAHSTKQEALKLDKPVTTPQPVAAAPTGMTIATTMASLPDTTAMPVTNTERTASKVANLAAGIGAMGGPSGSAIPAAATIAQPSSATFQQSLTVQAKLTATTLTQANPAAATAAWPASSQAASGSKSLPAYTDLTSAALPQQPATSPDSSSAPASVAHAVATAVSLSAAIDNGMQVQAPGPQAQPQTLPAHKASAKPVLAAEAPQAVVQPSVSASPAESKPDLHLSATAVALPILSADASIAIPAPIANAHTPTAVTALSNPTEPALTAAASVTSTYAATDTLQHTTLSSTPTTLEVGVATGTHGWLKIRAELNTSGTVDASLTGANSAASRLHNDLPALSSFLRDERVAIGSLNVAAPGGPALVPHAAAASTLEPASSFTRSAAEGLDATGTAVATDAGASGGGAPRQQAPENSPGTSTGRDSDTTIAVTAPAFRYRNANELSGSGELSESGYGGSWLNVRV